MVQDMFSIPSAISWKTNVSLMHVNKHLYIHISPTLSDTSRHLKWDNEDTISMSGLRNSHWF